MSLPILPIFRPRTRAQLEAVEALAMGRARDILMGRDPAVNRLARHLAAIARPGPPAPPPPRRILTPAEWRAAERRTTSP